MEAKDRTDASLARRIVQSRGGRMAIRAAGWLVAIPALCALVVIGGAAPIYLLLPEATPVAREATVPGSMQTASILPSPQAGATDDPPADESEGVDEGASPVFAAPPPEETPEPVAPEDIAGSAPPAEKANDAPPMADNAAEAPALVVTVVPTARPNRDTGGAPVASADALKTDDRQPTSRTLPAAIPRPPERREASRPTKRFVTIRPVALRSGPGGREVAMLGRGAEVLAGPCDDWCEVSAGGVKGWIHPSFLSASVPQARSQRSAPRTADPYDDEMRRDEGIRRYDRRRRDDARGWLYEDEQPIEIYDRRR